MGGLGSHHAHSYALEVAAFCFSMLFPGSVLALLAGAVKERLRRRDGRPGPKGAPALVAVRLATQPD